MFSKEWFVYVFGRWLMLAGIAGSLVQFILACIFWFVDKTIFKHHLLKTGLSKHLNKL
ncbi:MAG: hypothetical protein KAW82_01590 [Desulfurellaceae bacterium]|nr:hypothetical protein [Desulfurellaceae bacterium]